MQLKRPVWKHITPLAHNISLTLSPTHSLFPSSHNIFTATHQINSRKGSCPRLQSARIPPLQPKLAFRRCLGGRGRRARALPSPLPAWPRSLSSVPPLHRCRRLSPSLICGSRSFNFTFIPLRARWRFRERPLDGARCRDGQSTARKVLVMQRRSGDSCN